MKSKRLPLLMMMVVVLLLVAVGLCLVDWRRASGREVRAVPGVGDLALSDAEQKQMREEAAAGNATAAYRLGLHFEMVMLNEAEGEAWLRRAADLGHAGARKLLDDMADRRRMGQVYQSELEASRRR